LDPSISIQVEERILFAEALLSNSETSAMIESIAAAASQYHSLRKLGVPER
jgi:hypothetical protein